MAHGGKRAGAGRPKGKGPYGEPTECLRVPVSMVDDIRRYAATRGYKIPLYSSRVQAGVPEPADDNLEDRVDLTSYLVKRPSETFLVRATGESMTGAGIHDGDLLVVDKSIRPVSGKIVVAAVDGQVTVKTLRIQDGKTFLMPENAKFKPILVDEEGGVVIWGVVTASIQSH